MIRHKMSTASKMEIWFYKRNILTRVGRNCTAVGLLRVTAQQLCQQHYTTLSSMHIPTALLTASTKRVATSIAAATAADGGREPEARAVLTF